MNLWKQFEKAITSGGPRYIGEVVSTNNTFADQRCTVILTPGGASLEVTGIGRSLEIGQRWVIQDGKIIDEAPSGSVFNVDI